MASRLGSNASHTESDIEIGGSNVHQAKPAAAGSPLRGGRWIRSNRRVLCAGPGGDPETLAVVDVEPLDYHAESDRLPEHVASPSAARPARARLYLALTHVASGRLQLWLAASPVRLSRFSAAASLCPGPS